MDRNGSPGFLSAGVCQSEELKVHASEQDGGDVGEEDKDDES